MWPDLLAESETAAGFHRWTEIESVGPSDDKHQIARAGIFHRAQHVGEGFAGHALAARIEEDDMRACGNARRQLLAFFRDARAGLAQFGYGNLFDRHGGKAEPLAVRARAGEIILGERAFR